MENTYYRSAHPEKLLKRIARSAKRRKRTTLLILLALIVFLFMLFDNKGLITRIRLEQQKRAWLEQLRADSLEIEQLRQHIKALESNYDTLEHIARERYGMAREGETVYQIPTDQKQR